MKSEFFGVDIDRSSECLGTLMILANHPILYLDGKASAATSVPSIYSPVEGELQTEISAIRRLRSIVPASQCQLRMRFLGYGFFVVPVTFDTIVGRFYAGNFIDHNSTSVPVCDDKLEGILPPVARQHEIRLSITHGKVRLSLRLLGLRRQIRESEKSCQKATGCSHPPAHRREPCKEAIAIGRATGKFHRACDAKINYEREYDNKWTQPVPKACRLHLNPPFRECGLAIVLRRPGLFFCQDSAGFFVLLVPVGGVMNARMAEWVQGNDRINIIRPAISPSVDVVAFEIWLVTFGLKWRWSFAAFANAFCSAENVGRNGSRAVVNVSFPSGARPIVACVYRLLPKRLVANPTELFDFRLEHILGQHLAADQIEYDLGLSISLPANLDFMVPVVEPFAFETILAILLDEEENGPPVLHVVSDLVVIVVPGVTFFRALTVVLIATVYQKLIAIAVGVTLGVRDYDNRIFSIIAVADPHHLIATKSDANVCASMKNFTNVFVPRHVSSPLSLPQAVSTDAGCIGVKEDR